MTKEIIEAANYGVYEILDITNPSESILLLDDDWNKVDDLFDFLIL